MTMCRLARPGRCVRCWVSSIPISRITNSRVQGTGGAIPVLTGRRYSHFWRNTRFPHQIEVRKIDFVTASPAVSSRAHWLSIEAQLKALLPSKVHHRARARAPAIPRHHRECRAAGARPWTCAARCEEWRTDPDRARRSEVAAAFGEFAREPMAIGRSGWFALAARGRSASRRRRHLERARRDRALSRKRFATGLFSSTGQKGHPRRTRGRLRGLGSTRRCSGTGATARSTSSRTRACSNPAGTEEFRDRNVIVYGHAESNAAWPVPAGGEPGAGASRQGEDRLADGLGR